MFHRGGPLVDGRAPSAGGPPHLLQGYAGNPGESRRDPSAGASVVRAGRLTARGPGGQSSGPPPSRFEPGGPARASDPGGPRGVARLLLRILLGASEPLLGPRRKPFHSTDQALPDLPRNLPGPLRDVNRFSLGLLAETYRSPARRARPSACRELRSTSFALHGHLGTDTTSSGIDS